MQTAIAPPHIRTASLRNWLYLLSLVPAAAVVVGNLAGGFWAWSNLVLSFGIFAIMELSIPNRTDNVDSGEDDRLPNAILGLHLLAQVATLATLFYGIYAGILHGWSLVGAIVSTGINSGSGAITVGHELCHRKEAFWRWGSKWLLGSSANPYFYVAHVQVHHKLVATQHDSTTARYREALYPFVLRSIRGQMNDTFKFEADRLRKAGQAPYGWRNYGTGSFILMLLGCVGLYVWIGWPGVLAWLGQGIVANFLLEYINYIQHYGLLRRPDDKGILPRVNVTHAWHSDHATRFFLVDLSRHPDHHTYGAKPYHTLRRHDISPVLPTGYSGMIYLALIPPLYFRVMDKQLESAVAAANR